MTNTQKDSVRSFVERMQEQGKSGEDMLVIARESRGEEFAELVTEELDRQEETENGEMSPPCDETSFDRAEPDAAESDSTPDGVVELPIDEIKVDEEAYPRLRVDEQKVEQYAVNWERITAPIDVALVDGEYLLEDGQHRVEAARKLDHTTIRARVFERTSLQDVLTHAIRKNARHGLQLSMDDKRALALKFCPDLTVAEITKLLSVSQSVVYKWTQPEREQAKIELDERIVARIEAGERQSVIAAEEGVAKSRVSEVKKTLVKNSTRGKSDDSDDSGVGPEWQEHHERVQNAQRQRDAVHQAGGAFRNLFGDSLPQGARQALVSEIEAIVTEALQAGYAVNIERLIKIAFECGYEIDLAQFSEAEGSA